VIELDSNVVKFNVYVKAQVNTLAKRGQTTNNLLINLFKGHEKANDVEFQDLICRKVNDYKEGRDVSISNLIIDTDMKHRARKLYNKWSAPTKEQEQILALTARVEQLKSQKLPKPVPKKPAPTGTKPKKDNKWAWKDTLPKDREPRTKLFEGKQHHCNCPFHKEQWVCHRAEDFMKNPTNAATGDRPALGDPATTPGNHRLNKAQLAAALLEEGEDSDKEEEEDDL
jgi:hypothetical protein